MTTRLGGRSTETLQATENNFSSRGDWDQTEGSQSPETGTPVKNTGDVSIQEILTVFQDVVDKRFADFQVRIQAVLATLLTDLRAQIHTDTQNVVEANVEKILSAIESLKERLDTMEDTVTTHLQTSQPPAPLTAPPLGLKPQR